MARQISAWRTLDERRAWGNPVVNRIYIEGGGDSKELRTRCREAFRKLFGSRFSGRMPRLVACGGREQVYSDFCVACGSTASPQSYIAMLVDSEDSLADVNETWQHLSRRDGWTRPAVAGNEQVLLMTTCMETWIVADRATLREHYGAELRENALPPLTNLEGRPRDEILESLERATSDCSNGYKKGKRSFDVLAKIKHETVENHLPSFRRTISVLDARL